LCFVEKDWIMAWPCFSRSDTRRWRMEHHFKWNNFQWYRKKQIRSQMTAKDNLIISSSANDYGSLSSSAISPCKCLSHPNKMFPSYFSLIYSDFESQLHKHKLFSFKIYQINNWYSFTDRCTWVTDSRPTVGWGELSFTITLFLALPFAIYWQADPLM